jgi:uroporphyrin-III C-methyltransferase
VREGVVVSGRVILLGAGPGAVDLLTLRGARALAEADLVLYDALVPAELLALAPRARKWFVGKRAGRPSIAQATIERLLVRAARRGHRVVRLKAGDPFVFGRGGEEALALAQAGVDCEVVPGVSSALAGPAAAGVPVTHRGLASGFVVVTAEPDAAWRRLVDELSPGSLTLVVLMGLRKRAAIASQLLARGWPGETPVMVSLAATQPGEARLRTTIAGLATDALPEGREGAPGVIVIGEVVRVADELDQLRAARGATSQSQNAQEFPLDWASIAS